LSLIQCSGHPPVLHSFPTRRSSDLNPTMSVALENGLSVTALHNHFFFDHPKVYFMHIEGQGTTEQLATAVRKVYDKIKEIRTGKDRKSTRLNSSHVKISYAVFCLKK